MADLSPGSIFAGYRIEDVAGHGGMGVVYRATDLSLDRPVALKFIAAELVDDPDFRRRFAAESRTAASLDHPNVVPIYHAGEHEGELFLVMRYVEGEDLRSEIAEHGSLEPDRVVRVTTQIASALDAAHAAGLVHRDVKPANFLLTPSDHAYLTDFGLTKRLLAGGNQTETGRLLGTLDYVAPEQIRGGGVDPRTDVYALGCVLFHALTGRVPFRTREREAKLWAHVSQPPPSVGPGIPAAFDAVIARAMAKEPSDRFDSAGELAAAATTAAAGATPPEAPAPEPGAATDDATVKMAQGQKDVPMVSLRGSVSAHRTAKLSSPRAQRATPAVAERPSVPPSHSDYRRALVGHALLAPFSLAVLLGMLAAGVLFDLMPVVVPVALLAYAAAAAVIYFDKDIQKEVLERQRAKPGRAREGGPLEAKPGPPERPLSPRIATLLDQALEKRARIRDAVDRADLPYSEVLDEVDRLLATMRQTAARAELLHEGLQDAPPDAAARRLDELRAEHDPGKTELIDALEEQLSVQQRIELQLNRFYDRMERMLVSLDTIRGHLITVPASTDVDNQERLAAKVQDLRQEAGAMAEGMAATHAEQTLLIETEGR